MKNYSITCNCGREIKGESKRKTEAGMWHHAIQDHADMVKGMSIEQFEAIMDSWDKEFAEQEK